MGFALRVIHVCFVAQEGDTLIFSAVGFKRSQFVVPTDLEESKYSMIHQLSADTILLGQANVYPWPSREQFRDAFLNLKLADDDYPLADAQSLPGRDAAAHGEPAARCVRELPLPDGDGPDALVPAGWHAHRNLFNPIAWAQFLQAWKSGAFKKKQ